jgi:hypothetical protein
LGAFDINAITPFGSVTGLTGSGPYYKVTTTKSPVLIAPKALTGTKFYLNFLWECSSTSGNNPGLCIDDIVLKGVPYSVDTVISASYTENIPANTNNLLRSTKDDIIASISGNSTTINNVIASITQAGTAKTAFTIGSSTYQRSQKLISLATNTIDTTSTYNATLYYTTTEVAAWGTLANIRVLQLKNGITFSSTSIAKTNAVIITPTSVTDKRTTDGYVAVNITVKGLGVFALVDNTVTLPLIWKSVTGTVVNNAAVIKWQLSGAIEAGTTYSVEKSTDGINFTIVEPKVITGNSLTDAAITASKTYYYRVIATGADGTKLYSQVLNIYYIGLNHSFSISPNPFSSRLVVAHNEALAGKTVLKVFDIAGREIYTKNYANTTETTNINTESWLPGLYIVRINNEQSSITYKLVKH